MAIFAHFLCVGPRCIPTVSGVGVEVLLHPLRTIHLLQSYRMHEYKSSWLLGPSDSVAYSSGGCCKIAAPGVCICSFYRVPGNLVLLLEQAGRRYERCLPLSQDLQRSQL